MKFHGMSSSQFVEKYHESENTLAQDDDDPDRQLLGFTNADPGRGGGGNSYSNAGRANSGGGNSNNLGGADRRNSQQNNHGLAKIGDNSNVTGPMPGRADLMLDYRVRLDRSLVRGLPLRFLHVRDPMELRLRDVEDLLEEYRAMAGVIAGLKGVVEEQSDISIGPMGNNHIPPTGSNNLIPPKMEQQRSRVQRKPTEPPSLI